MAERFLAYPLPSIHPSSSLSDPLGIWLSCLHGKFKASEGDVAKLGPGDEGAGEQTSKAKGWKRKDTLEPNDIGD